MCESQTFNNWCSANASHLMGLGGSQTITQRCSQLLIADANLKAMFTTEGDLGLKCARNEGVTRITVMLSTASYTHVFFEGP